MIKKIGKIKAVLLLVLLLLFFPVTVQATEISLQGEIVGNRFLVPMYS
mgnify:CR=1 FL=1|jgi:hypothetical protein